MTLDQAFARLRGAFPTPAEFQGTHFKYAVRDGVVLIERKRMDRYSYWLLCGERHVLIHASRESKLSPMKTIGDSFTISPAAHD